MRILIYNEAFWPSVGGVETVVSLMARYLHEQGERVVVVTQTPGRSNDPSFPFPLVRQPSKSSLLELVSESDLIHLHSFHSLLLFQGKLRRKKIVCTYNDLTAICPNGIKMKVSGPCLHKAGPRMCYRCLRNSHAPRVFRRLVRPLFKCALSFFIDANVCVSPFGMRRFLLWRKQLITYGIDTSVFCPGPRSDTMDCPQVIFAGRLVPEKGCQVAIDALRLCVQQGRPFNLQIVGQGPEYPALSLRVASYGLQKMVRFRDFLETQELAEMMRRADVAVVPSLYDEMFGLVAVEAFSSGLAVVGANVGGLGEVVAEAGIAFRRGDSQDLAACLERLFLNPEIRRQLGSKARAIAVEKYDYHRMAAAYHDLYRQLVKVS
jgi:glycogen(starch) synthase